MTDPQEITVYTIGDSTQIRTWSNVPFFFTNALLKRGLRVNRVDLSPAYAPRIAFDSTVRTVARAFQKGTSYDYFRSSIYYFDARRRIAAAVKSYPNSDAHVFLTFSFSAAGLTRKPTILLCDRTYRQYIRDFLERQPDPLERRSALREDSQIEASTLVVPLFPGVAEQMRHCYANPNITYLGNAINSLQVPSENVIAEKAHSTDIIFIGGGLYRTGAEQLIEAFSILRTKHTSLQLHIIGAGMTTASFGALPKGVQCYGYLDKLHSDQNNVYYSLLRKARVIVNTTRKWGGFSAVLEAMYLYTPVITAPYMEFVRMFGETIPFGRYCQDGSSDALCTALDNVLQNDAYASLCHAAHCAAKDHTWHSLTGKLLSAIAATGTPGGELSQSRA